MRTLVLTGGSRGLGLRALELILARGDWRVLLIARQRPQSEAIDRIGCERLEIIRADLSSLHEVDAACDAVLTRLAGEPIHAMALNAGIQAIQGDQASQDGFEAHFAVNHLAHVLIADRLAPHLVKGGRIVITGSEVHDPQAFCLMGIERAEWQDPYDFADPAKSQSHVPGNVDRGEARYSASKLCNVMHARALAREYPHLAVVSFNPSVVPGTGIARERNALQRYLWRTLAPALADIVPGMRHVNTSGGDLAWLVCEAYLAPLTGSYIDGRRPDPGSDESRDEGKIGRLMQTSRALIGGVVGEHKKLVNA